MTVEIITEEEPNISSTRWRTVIDHQAGRYFFESAISPSIFWVDLNKVDFKPGADVKKLDLGKDQSNIFSGEVSGEFVTTKPFKFLGITEEQLQAAIEQEEALTTVLDAEEEAVFENEKPNAVPNNQE